MPGRTEHAVEEIVVEGWNFNPPPYWPRPPVGWSPSPSWQPDPAWGPVPAGWQLWVRQSHGYRRPVASVTVGLMSLLAIGGIGVLFPRSGGAGQVRPAVGFAQPSIVMPSDGSSPSAAADPTRLVPYLAAAGPAPQDTPASSATPAPTSTPAQRFTSCGALNAVYPHGVGLPDATDRQADGTPVTNFGRSTSIYGANVGQDSDHDGIACEHH